MGQISGTVQSSLTAWQKYSRAATPPQNTAEGRRNRASRAAGIIGAMARPVATVFGKISEGDSQDSHAVIQTSMAKMPSTA